MRLVFEFSIFRWIIFNLMILLRTFFYFVLHMFCFSTAAYCKRYRVRLHNDAHFLLLVYFLFSMICDIFICIFQLRDKVVVFYEQDNFDLHVIDVTVQSMYLSNYLWKCNLNYLSLTGKVTGKLQFATTSCLLANSVSFFGAL